MLVGGGLVDAPLKLLYTPGAVTVALAQIELPLMVLPLITALSNIDPALRQASLALGAGRWRTFVQVTLPLSMPGVVAGTLLTFIPAAGDYINAELLGNTQTRMLGNVIQDLFTVVGDYPAAAALSVTLMLLIAGIVMAYVRRTGTEDLL